MAPADFWRGFFVGGKCGIIRGMKILRNRSRRNAARRRAASRILCVVPIRLTLHGTASTSVCFNRVRVRKGAQCGNACSVSDNALRALRKVTKKWYNTWRR